MYIWVHVSSCRNDTSAAQISDLRDLLGAYMLRMLLSNASRLLGRLK